MSKPTRAVFFAAFALSAALGAADMVTSLDDIHYWVGEGNQRCAVVIDWGASGKALAWGYRWNGTCTNLSEVVKRIAHDDPRLVVGVQQMTADYEDFYFFGYDVNDCHPAWNLQAGTCSDPQALKAREAEDFSFWWVFFGPFASALYPPAGPDMASLSAGQIIPQDGDWYCFRHDQWTPTYALAVPEAAESPYGYQVVASATSASSTSFNRPENVLGRPTIYMSGAWGGPVNPYNPAWMAGELFSLESDGDEDLEPGEPYGPGYVTIKFDHRVMDDPANPYGLDLIVFGNALAVGNSTEWYSQTTDPSKVSFTGKGGGEEAVVEVSQDGTTWYTFASPFADCAMPTLGLEYDTTAPDVALFSGNCWWGRATQATRPMRPTLDFADFKGHTLAEVCQYYNGSAGGTGYDIGVFDLPKDASGRKWIQYVRVRSRYADDLGEGDSGYTAPDIDAVADVAPISAYELWVERNYADWTTAWKRTVTGPDAVAPNGRTNGENFVLGLAADESLGGAVPALMLTGVMPGEDGTRLEVRTRQPFATHAGFFVKAATELAGAATDWVPEWPTVESSEFMDGSYRTVLKVSSAGHFFKLAWALDE